MFLLLPVVFLSYLFVPPVIPQGFKCSNTNYRLFTVYTNLNDLWRGSTEDALTMCRNSGHVPAKSTSCLQQLFQNATVFFGKQAPKTVWIDQTTKRSNETKCVAWSQDNNGTDLVPCTEKLVALCQGHSTEDHFFSETFKSGSFPYTQIFGATTPSGQQVSVIDAYYVLCGSLGIVLILIVVAAAVWRSGYINNRYSFRRLPAVNAPPQKPAKKSHTVTSQLDSEVPHGYVKASVTKETIA